MKICNNNRWFFNLVYNIWRRLLPRYGNTTPGATLLECGTGRGNLLALLEDWFPEMHLCGLEIDPEALNQARGNTRKTRFLLASAEVLPFPSATFDFIISLHMIEHLPDPERFVREASRTLRPGGILALATPNPLGVGARLMKRRWSGWCPEHISLHPPGSWQEMLGRNGFTILRDGTTGLSGIPIFRKSPLALLNWGLLLMFGFFPWQHGEAYVCLSQKEGNRHDATLGG